MVAILEWVGGATRCRGGIETVNVDYTLLEFEKAPKRKDDGSISHRKTSNHIRKRGIPDDEVAGISGRTGRYGIPDH